MQSQIACLNKCEITVVPFVWPFTTVCFSGAFGLSPLCVLKCVWEYFDLQGQWKKVLTDLKKSLYTLQADPKKSRDFKIKNPGTFDHLKIPGSRDSRDPVRACWSEENEVTRINIDRTRQAWLHLADSPAVFLFIFVMKHQKKNKLHKRL